MADEDRERDEHPEPDLSSKVSDLGAYIRNQRESAKLSLRNLAKLAGVSNPYLSQIERGLRKPSAEILQAIARALSISSETLYVKAGILEEREIDTNLETAIERDRHLTEQQRTALVEMYRSFRRLNALDAAEAPPRGGLKGILDAMAGGETPTAEPTEPPPPASADDAD